MSRIKLKICGITRQEEAIAIAALGVDAIGFILYPPSKRFLPPASIASIVSKLPPFLSTVGVLVNEPIETAIAIYQESKVKLLQLHGEESPEYCFQITQANIPWIKAFRVSPEFDFSQLSKYPGNTVLLDSYSSHEYGGTGTPFCWDSLQGVSQNIILAGGITPQNIQEAITTVQPYAIDVSSGVETSPGHQSISAIQSLLKRIKNLEKRDHS